MNGWIEYKAGFKYQLTSDYSIQTAIKSHEINTPYIKLDADGLLTLKCGYASDGASGITIDTRNSMLASFVHDALYWLIRNGHLDLAFKEYADKLFRTLLLDAGMWWPRAQLWYLGVKTQGIHSLYPSKEKPILRAP